MSNFMHKKGAKPSGAILVKEFRKGSWDNKMAETLQFINTKLQSKGQLIDVSLTMSNTDWQACIEVYYYKDVATMKQFHRDPNTYLKHGNLMCEWERYSKSWGQAAKDATESIGKYCAVKGKLFGVKHACGNHAHTHGGAVIFILYWSGINASNQQKEGAECKTNTYT